MSEREILEDFFVDTIEAYNKLDERNRLSIKHGGDKFVTLDNAIEINRKIRFYTGGNKRDFIKDAVKELSDETLDELLMQIEENILKKI